MRLPLILGLVFCCSCFPAEESDDDDTTAADDDTTAADDDTAADLAPSSLDGRTLVIDEPANGIQNTWDFEATTATGVGIGEFPYSYVKTGEAQSTLEFEVGGTDHYEMTWTSTTGGTCTESFEGSAPVDCSFIAP